MQIKTNGTSLGTPHTLTDIQENTIAVTKMAEEQNKTQNVIKVLGIMLLVLGYSFLTLVIALTYIIMKYNLITKFFLALRAG